MKAKSESPHRPDDSRRIARVPTHAAYRASSTRMPASSAVLSPEPNVEMAKFLTGSGVRSMAVWPTASTGELCGTVSPAASWDAPIATAAASTPTAAPASARAAAGVRGQVAHLPGARAAGEPQGAVVPHAPDRHDVRPPVWPDTRDPVVAGGGQPLHRPGPVQEPAAFGRSGDAVPRHDRPAHV